MRLPKWFGLTVIALFACRSPVRSLSANTPPTCEAPQQPFGWSEPEEMGVNPEKLLELTQWIQNSSARVFSITVSKNNRIVYELYTSKIQRNDAHYLMSVTKSFTSALVGVALDQGALRNVDQSIPDILPNSLFADPIALEKFQSVSLKEVMGMSALDAQVAPHLNTPEARQRLHDFYVSPNRTKFALTQKLLASPGKDFQYTDVTPLIAAGAVEYNTNQTLFDLANQNLFGPMEFKNQEWSSEDPSGIDNGSWGLRLRPIDMQKFGMLYLDQGCWNNQQLLSKDWVSTSFQSWIKSKPALKENDYGYFWWHYFWPGGWTAHLASGWRGQRIAVFPEKGVVLTMTADIEDGSESHVFGEIFNRVAAAVDTPLGAGADLSSIKMKLAASIKDVSQGPSRINPAGERRMIPSQAPIDPPHHGLRAL
jgi:CubicO group peptidase (beta-lactamase class C family)